MDRRYTIDGNPKEYHKGMHGLLTSAFKIRSYTDEAIMFLCACAHHVRYKTKLTRNGAWEEHGLGPQSRDVFDSWKFKHYECKPEPCQCCCPCCNS